MLKRPMRRLPWIQGWVNISPKTVIQKHHITPEQVVKVYKGEHEILTKLSWRKRVSKGFIEALKDWISKNEDKAVQL